MVYGYARCSTNEDKQDINRQKRELFKLGVTDDRYIFWEYVSGTKADRQELKALLDVIREGDTIVTTEVSRLSRSTKHLCELLEIVKEQKIKLNIGNSFVVDCSKGEIDPMTEGMIKMWGVFAEMEQKMICERVKSGIQNARSKGVSLGRPKLTKESLPKNFNKYFKKYKQGALNVTEFAKLVGCSRVSIYNYIKIAKEN